MVLKKSNCNADSNKIDNKTIIVIIGFCYQIKI